MKLMTYNIRLGLQRGLDAIAEVVARVAPDVLALQEVGRYWAAGPYGDTTAELAARCGLAHTHYIPAITEPPDDDAGARAAERPEAHYGHALLSRHPIVSREVEPLPRQRDEPRALARTVLEVEELGGAIVVFSTHLSHIDDRPAQGRALLERVTAQLGAEHPVFVMGDLNEWGERDPWCVELLERMVDADAELGRLTFPAEAPERRIDFVLADRGTFPEVEVVPELHASDHRPVWARWRPPGRS